MNDKVESSGIRKTQADWFAVYCFRWNSIYIFDVPTFSEYYSKGFISERDNKLCNSESSSGQTMRYLLDAFNFEKDGFFVHVYENVLPCLDLM